ncbi:MAG TPA: sigma factor, partial [Actinomycetota bacterium]|nr:sigma factor [Actinomycetota bacterium]
MELLIAERGQALLSAAVLLGGSRAAGEDLLQGALERVVRSWRRIDGNLEAYLRRTLYNLAVDGWRHRGRNPEVLAPAEPPAVPDETHIIDLRGALVDALAALAPRQRAVLVL